MYDMETTYIIYDLINKEYFAGCDSDGKPMFDGDITPLHFVSEEEAMKRLNDEIELFGKWFLIGRFIEIKNIYSV